MRRIQPNIYRHGKRFTARIVARVDGQRREVLRSFDTVELAAEFVRRWKSVRAFGTAGLVAPGSPASIRATSSLKPLLAAYLGECAALGRSPRTIRGYVWIVKFIHRGLGDRPVPLSRADLLDLARWSRATPGPRGATRADNLRKAFVLIGTAHRRAELPVPPAPKVDVIRKGRRVLTPAETRKLLDAMPVGSVERTFAEIMLRTACRDAEARRLTRADVDLNAGVLAFRNRTGSRVKRIEGDRVPISPGLKVHLVARLRGIPDKPDAVLLPMRGRELRDGALRRRLARACEKAAIKPAVCGLAWLRNLALTMLTEGGVPVEVGSRLAGHASTAITEGFYDRAKLWSERETATRKLDATLDGLRGRVRSL